MALRFGEAGDGDGEVDAALAAAFGLVEEDEEELVECDEVSGLPASSTSVGSTTSSAGGSAASLSKAAMASMRFTMACKVSVHIPVSISGGVCGMRRWST